MGCSRQEGTCRIAQGEVEWAGGYCRRWVEAGKVRQQVGSLCATLAWSRQLEMGPWRHCIRQLLQLTEHHQQNRQQQKQL
jgi:hypothetical protein